jgi:hypothetical protein
MSGSVARPAPLRNALVESVRQARAEDAKELRSILSNAEGELADLWHLTISREEDGQPAADHKMLDRICRVADELKAAADKYKWEVS